MPRSRIALLGVLGVVVIAAALFLTLGNRHSPSTPRPAVPAAAPKAPTSIETASFHASVPAGWVLVEQRTSKKGARGIHLSSTGKAVSGLGIAPAGTAAITIAESAPGLLGEAKIDGRPASSLKPVALFPHVIGQPAQAVGIRTGEAPTATNFQGARAAEAAFGYGFEGRSMMQVDLLAERGGRLFTVELDAEPSLATQSTAAVNQLLSSWRWH